MKIFISSDIEGTAGIADWGQVLTSGEYEMGRRLLLNEVNAAIDGAIAGGARSVVVNDSHWTMQNLYPAELHGRASYISGKHKPLYMMEGLDGSFDAVLLVAYHGSISAERAVLSHTYNPFAFHDVKLNGRVVGESALNALVALHHKVPVALITGDDVTIAEAEPFMPGIEGVVVKRSITRFAAESLHPEEACERIRDGAQRALERLGDLAPPAFDLPVTLDMTFLTADMAEMATWVEGVERTDTRSTRLVLDHPLELYKRFCTVGILVRSIAEGGMSPAGRAAVVTGAAGAIGAAIADRLEADGLRVARSDLGPAAEYPCDVRREDDVIGLRESVQERLGAPWLLVNVAGVFFEHDVPDTTEEQFDLIVDTNLKGTFLTCKAFLPAMLAAGDGCIVNIASTAGIRGGHRRAVYNASKGGVVLLTRSLALDHAPAGVRINCVCPGLIDTPMADWIRLDPSELAAFEGWAPARRMGTPQEIAGAVSFLASEDAAYMHGAVMVVDGGTTA